MRCTHGDSQAPFWKIPTLLAQEKSQNGKAEKLRHIRYARRSDEARAGSAIL